MSVKSIALQVTCISSLNFTMKLEGGDDLEDDFVPDDLVALSESEGEGEGANNGEFVAGEGCEDEEDSTDLAPQAAKKRKRREREKEKKAKVCPSNCVGVPTHHATRKDD
jgi:protein CMS1